MHCCFLITQSYEGLKKYNENGLTWDVIISLFWSTQLCIHPTLCFNPLLQSLISTSYIILGRVKLYCPFWELILHPSQSHNNTISSLNYLLVVFLKPSQVDGKFMVNSPSKPFLPTLYGVHLSTYLNSQICFLDSPFFPPLATSTLCCFIFYHLI